MIGVATEETNGSDQVPDLKRLRCEPGLERHFFRYSERALLFECTRKCCRKGLDTADIVRDACLQQLTSGLLVIRKLKRPAPDEPWEKPAETKASGSYGLFIPTISMQTFGQVENVEFAIDAVHVTVRVRAKKNESQ